MKNRLRYYRERAGLTLAQLSDKTGIDISNLSRAERGSTDFAGQRWLIVAEELGCTVDELLRLPQN